VLRSIRTFASTQRLALDRNSEAVNDTVKAHSNDGGLGSGGQESAAVVMERNPVGESIVAGAAHTIALHTPD